MQKTVVPEMTVVGGAVLVVPEMTVAVWITGGAVKVVPGAVTVGPGVVTLLYTVVPEMTVHRTVVPETTVVPGAVTVGPDAVTVLLTVIGEAGIELLEELRPHVDSEV